MAINVKDCLVLLSDIKDSGVDCSQITEKVLLEGVTLEVIKFINDNRQLEVTQFYEKLRRSYNHKKSKLYINIVKNDFKSPKDIVITLASLNLQVLLFAKQLEDPSLFLNHSRLSEINMCLYNYSKTYEIIPCQKLLSLIRTDLKVLESINRRV